jgi:hypothetical protein
VTGNVAAGDERDDLDIGGDPACWLDRVCPECGGFMKDAADHECRPAAAGSAAEAAPTPP